MGSEPAGRDEVQLRDGVVLLRPWRPDDAAAVHAACQDPEIQRWTTVPSPYAEADAVEFVSSLAPAGWASGGELTFAVVAEDRIVASVGLMRGSGRVSGRAGAIGYWAAPDGRGRGYVTRAVRLVCGWAFGELGLARVQWHAEVGNAASRAVAERAGFRMEGVARAALTLRGRVADAWQGALLPGDPMDGTAVPPLRPPTLRTGRLVLRPLAGDDVDAVAASCQDPTLLRWLPELPSPYTRADAEQFVHARHAAPWEGRLDLVMSDAESGRFAGMIGLRGVGGRPRRAEVGYWVAARERAQGYATEALLALTEWALGELGLHRIELRADVGNVASRRVAERAGYAQEGIARAALAGRDGTPRDIVEHARLAGEPAPAAMPGALR
ncbi:MAG: GNAT family N-acetyltransferase [Frankiaceae bacterium]